eukprot:TRINITY_DN11554_c0_g2_i1.p1 TRINITY_DN11554_c0_g2~~TRINITY_DN11554_c0_g2_i1.p1  ORF type:complete len:184 (-),score=25.53 TRINITY_DN11554_c0_g2_i1:271-822(-)
MTLLEKLSRRGHASGNLRGGGFISNEAQGVVKGLLQVSPDDRMTAVKALEHPWMRDEDNLSDTSVSIVDAMQSFTTASKFPRCCLQMIAWSLFNVERARVRRYFLRVDTSRDGTITFSELRDVLCTKFQISKQKIVAMFNCLDTNSDNEIHYSDFLAAMVHNRRLGLHDGLLRIPFNKFDTDC